MGMIGAPGMSATTTPAPASMAGYGSDKRRASCSRAIAASMSRSRLSKNVIRNRHPQFVSKQEHMQPSTVEASVLQIGEQWIPASLLDACIPFAGGVAEDNHEDPDTPHNRQPVAVSQRMTGQYTPVREFCYPPAPVFAPGSRDDEGQPMNESDVQQEIKERHPAINLQHASKPPPRTALFGRFDAGSNQRRYAQRDQKKQQRGRILLNVHERQPGSPPRWLRRPANRIPIKIGPPQQTESN